jgi:CRP-like cAMP-binding protein
VDAWLLKIEREDFYDLLADHSEMTQRMFKALVKRVRSLLALGLGEGQAAKSSTHA